jgi:hypothetical protein
MPQETGLAPRLLATIWQTMALLAIATASSISSIMEWLRGKVFEGLP